MSAKTVLSNVIPIVNRKGNIRYICNESSFFWFVSCFQSFPVNVLPVLKSVAFTWCEVIAIQTILW